MPRPPARLVGYFAEKAPICVIARRGPTRYSQLTLWRTDTDEFTPGQWLYGHINRAWLSSEGTYFAVGIMGARPLGRIGGEQYQLICRPPYWTALEGWHKALCLGIVAFLPDDRLVCPPNSPDFGKAITPCPFIRTGYSWPPMCAPHKHVIDASHVPASGVDQRGRKIAFEAGRIYHMNDDGSRLLWDANKYEFEEVIAPDWATTW